MKDQILKVTFPDGIDARVEINFTTAKDWDDVNAAAEIIANIGDFPAAEITFDMQEDDGRKEVFVMNTRTGINTKLFFRNEGRTAAIIIPHDATLADELAKPVMWAIPFPCLEWAALRAK